MSVKLLNDFSDLIQQVTESYEETKNQLDYWKQKYKEYDRDDNVSSLKEQIDDIRSRSLLIFSKKESERDKAFRRAHYDMHECDKNKATGNTYVYTLTGAGIGTIINITCPICGQSKDITDIESW